MQEGTKAHENGERYALAAARNAGAVERRGQPAKSTPHPLKARLFYSFWTAGQGDTNLPPTLSKRTSGHPSAKSYCFERPKHMIEQRTRYKTDSTFCYARRRRFNG